MTGGSRDRSADAGASAGDGRVRLPMDGAYIRRWREDVTARLDRLLPGFEVRFGYPPGRHTIGGPAGEEELASLAGTRLPGDLLAWYRQVREVSLPDIGNGYFIHEPGLVACREVTSIRGRFTEDVVVFASDGGGTLFASGAVTDSPVYRLPAGEIVAGVYRSDDPRIDVVAENLTDFLDRLRDTVEVFAATGAAGDL
ncbi:SMI1/KNR4 family protein [Micromonospora sp. NPDC047548]|uniref:SMI1/KNR4 family protein n=1 Tax=Micromonospora sp. NPDC047548 TaxID=3155624 RepID=UPI0033DBF7CA